MNELRTEAKMALANYESSYGAFGKEASFSMDDVYVVQDYIDQLEAVADKFANKIERLREALKKIEYHSQDWEAIEIAHDALREDE